MELPSALRERYQPLSLLGEGGFGAVWRCRDRKLGRELALKLLVVGDDAEMVARFEREARVTAQLRSPHVVEVYDHGVADGVPWIAYALLDGCDLDAWRRREGRPGAARLGAWAVQGAEALAVVHEAGLVHRDVKPANVFVRAEDEGLVLVDFGIARAEQRAEGTLHTAEGMILGTPGYMAPELFRGYPPSAASDQWAWAAVLAELLTGAPVYGSYEPGAVVRAAAGFRPDDRVPAVLRRALAADPGKRYPDTGAFAAALREVEWDAPVASPGASTGAREAPTAAMGAAGSRPPPRGRVPWVAALGLALLGVGLGWMTQSGPPQEAPPSPPPSPSEEPVPRVDLEEVRRLGQEVRSLEASIRQAVATRGSDSPWLWRDAPPEGVEPRSRVEQRAALVPEALTDRWSQLTARIARWLAAVDPLDGPLREELAPEVYRTHRMVDFLAAFLGNTRSLSKVHIGNYQDLQIGAGEVSRELTSQLQVRIAAALDLADRLLEVPGASPTLVHTAHRIRLGCRDGSHGAALLEILKGLPTRDAASDRGLLVFVLDQAIDPFMPADPFGDLSSEDPPLWPEESRCQRTAGILPKLGELVRATTSPGWRQEQAVRVLVLELAVARACPEVRGPEVVRRFRSMVEALRSARAEAGKAYPGLAAKLPHAHRQWKDLAAEDPALAGQLEDPLQRAQEADSPGPFSP